MRSVAMIVQRVALLLIVAVTASACTSSPPPQEGRDGHSAAPPPGPAVATDARAGAVVLDCGSAIFPTAPDWRKRTLRVGPVGFWFSHLDADLLRVLDQPIDGRYQLLKVPVTVSDRTAVTVVVPEEERAKVSLLYDRKKFGSLRYLVSEGDRAVTFVPCQTSKETSWAGGFIVAGRQCASLDVYEGEEPQAHHILIPFGLSDCG